MGLGQDECVSQSLFISDRVVLASDIELGDLALEAWISDIGILDRRSSLSSSEITANHSSAGFLIVDPCVLNS